MKKRLQTICIALVILLLLLLFVLNTAGLPFYLVAMVVIFVILGSFFQLDKSLVKPIEELSLELKHLLDSKGKYEMHSSGIDEIIALTRPMNRLAIEFVSIQERVEKLHIQAASQDKNARRFAEMGSHFRKLFETANYGVFLYDLEGKILNVNKKACQMLGYDKDGLIGLSFWSLFDERHVLKPVEAVTREGNPTSLQFETVILKLDGSEIPVEISSNEIDLSSGKTQCIVTDITSRKKMENKLRNSEEKFRTFMESANDFMFMLDKYGRFTYVNQAMVRVTGYTEAELLSKHVVELSPEDSSGYHLKRPDDLITDEGETRELTWKTASDQVVYGDVTATGVFGHENEFRGIRGVFRNVTDKRRIQESQRLSQLGKITADISHEIKNRLAAIMSIAELSLLDGTEQSEIIENLQMIKEQSRYMDDFVRRMLSFAKPSQGIIKVVQIHDVIDFALKVLEKKFYKEQIEVLSEYGDNLPDVYIDDRQISEVLVNILQNAQEAMPGSGQIRIKTSVQNEMVLINCIDNGQGISEENLKKIFDPFFTTKETGTGLGVPACYGIIHAHGGELTYSSKVGEGTTVSITLPTDQSQIPPKK